MNEKWRPPNWGNPYDGGPFREGVNPLTTLDQRHSHQAYEAGASAMSLPAYQQGQRDKEAELASQCGPEPCGVCDGCGSGEGEVDPTIQPECIPWREWKGQQAGYAKAQEELRVTNALLEERNKVLDAIPECPEHGKQCIPHALEWIADREKAKVEGVKLALDCIDCGTCIAFDDGQLDIEAWITSQGMERP